MKLSDNWTWEIYEVNRKVIKVIKRKAANVPAFSERGYQSDQNLETSPSKVKNERDLQRKLKSTVSNWIVEYRQASRVKEVSGIRRMLGSDAVLSNIA